MNILLVVANPRDWPVAIHGVETISARTYLFDSAYCDRQDTRVFNLCHSHRYQDRGYYVSLLAEARGHQPVPDVKAIEDVHAGEFASLLADGVADDLAEACGDADEGALELDIFFGRTRERRHGKIGARLFNLLRLPLMRVRFEIDGARWHVASVASLRIAALSEEQKAFAASAAGECLKGHCRRASSEPAAQRPALAILNDRSEPGQPSNSAAIQRFCAAAENAGMRCELIGRNDIERLSEFDALFIRDNTCVDHYTYRFARQAAVSGLVAIDDPDSILKCGNKLYLAELMNHHRLPTPKTLAVHRDNIGDIVPVLGLPCILKKPDGAFSSGVVKAHTEEDARRIANEFLEDSDLILAQEYLPTEFDWRIGILDRKLLFACKYHMVPGHWQIIEHQEDASYVEGMTEAVAIEDIPEQAAEIALKAAGLIGDGFYGVDLKQRGQHFYLIEINDNPNVDAGNEDEIQGEALYREVMEVFRRRIEARKGRRRS